MQLLTYYIVFALIWLFNQIPMRILYVLSDLVYLLLFYVFPYRKKVVFSNMRNSFPEWDEKMVRKQAKRFYRFFSDFFMESTLFVFMKEKEIMNRFRYKNPELVNDLYHKGKSVILIFGHYGNWEFLAGLQKFLHHRSLGVYRPLHNRYIDQMFINSRQRFGLEAIPSEKIVRILSDYHQKGILNISYFACDQRPLMRHIQYWTTFLNQDTPVVMGPEKLAKKLDLAVVYIHIKRIKRGFYESDFHLITDQPRLTREHEITDKFFELLEKQIIEEPACWLWTHKRWKHDKKEYERRFGHRDSIRTASHS